MRVLLAAFACLILFGCTRIESLPPEKKELVSVREVPGVTKDQLYLRARGWFAKTFVSAKAVLEIQDKETGELTGNTIIPLGTRQPDAMSKDDLRVTVSITVKDGKYRAVFNRFDSAHGITWDFQLEDALKSSQGLETSLLEAMQQAPKDF